MYYYAYLDLNDICIAIYAMPSQISGDQYIYIPSNDTTLVGQHYNRESEVFEVVYYYANLNERNIVTSTMFSLTQLTTSDILRSITFAQYQTVTGLYWNGTEYITPPISVAAVASSDEINYKTQDKWLSTKLDEIEEDIADKADLSHTHGISDVTNLSTALSTLESDIADLETAVAGKSNTGHTHTAADLSGVVKTINGNAPDTNGNITVTSGGMTATEILTAVKTVDGADSGLDADTLDGIEATGFATASHNHDTVYSAIGHTHSDYLTSDDVADFITDDALSIYATTSAMNTALSGKSDTTHNHDSDYADISHVHTIENVTGLATALAGKSSTDHNHNTAYAPISHSHSMDNITGLSTALSGKANSSHTHSQSDISGLSTALAGKANSSHTHSNYLSTSGGTVSGDLNVTGVLRANGNQVAYASSSSLTLGTNNLSTTVACSSSGDMVLNGARIQIPSLLPRNSGTFQIGNTSNRFSGIYLTNSPNVSSDARLKQNIKELDNKKLAEFVEKLNVVNYQYLNDNTDRIGLIAQEISKADPEIAKYLIEVDEYGYYSLKPTDLVFPLIATVQELKKEIEELKK